MAYDYEGAHERLDEITNTSLFRRSSKRNEWNASGDPRSASADIGEMRKKQLNAASRRWPLLVRLVKDEEKGPLFGARARLWINSETDHRRSDAQKPPLRSEKKYEDLRCTDMVKRKLQECDQQNQSR